MTGSMSKGERMAKSAAAVAVVAMAAAGCGGGGGVKNGNVTPDSVEKKAHTLAQQTLDAVRPVAGSADTSVDRDTWQKCTTETPGQHRFEYIYTLKLGVPRSRSKAVLDAAKAYFAKQGYVLDPSDGKNTRAGATLPKSTWTVRLGIKDSSTMVIQADSDCVFTTHDPKTSG
jgi:hypothetical protein